MTPQQQEFMLGWAYAARLAQIYDEAQCQMFCAFVPSEINTPESWCGFTAAMLSGYHEEPA